MLNKILAKINTLKDTANSQLSTEMSNIDSARSTFDNKLTDAQTSIQSLKPDYIKIYNDDVEKGKYILDILKNLEHIIVLIKKVNLIYLF